MIELALMIEGQQGLNWPRWQRLVRAAEDLGFAGLYRSDHFTDPDGPNLDALELWTSFTWLAGNTSRIEFGPLVSPVSFRHPVITAWQASAVDALAGGRLRLGLGAGWQEREHNRFGFDLLDTDRRFARFEEGLEVVTRLVRGDGPAAFDGAFYRLRDAVLMPRSPRPNGPPIVIGGNGPKRTLPLVARFADEWNAVFVTPERFAALSAHLDDLLRERGRAPDSVRRTLMTRVVLARDEAEARSRLGERSAEELRARGAIVGGPDQIVAALGRFAEVGVRRVMGQWLEMDDIAGLETVASAVLPQLANT